VDFECDPAKSLANQRKHDTSFDEAVTCLLDPMALVRQDFDVSSEQRYVLVGMSNVGRMLTVCYAMRGETPRLISARKATKKEQMSYAQRL
jgi:uncharacterized protein